MDTTTGTGRIAVRAWDHHGQLCTVTLEPGRAGEHRLRYAGGDRTTALLTAENVELLAVALTIIGRSVIEARHPSEGVCTLLVIGRRDEVRLYFHAVSSTCAVLDRAGTDRLRDALDALR